MQDQREASGLLFRRNRYYDPATGQFTQQDPIGVAGGMNLYGFANGDPVNFSDPFGLTPVCLPWCLGGALGVATGYATARLLGTEYGPGDAAVDFALGAAGAGALDKLGDLNRARKAYSAAQGGGRHAGLLRNMAGESAESVARGIRNLERGVTRHQGYLRNPSSKVSNWNSLTPQHQQNIVKNWQREIDIYQEQADVLRGLLRGGG
jgi:RHS repeat-associated protein